MEDKEEVKKDEPFSFFVEVSKSTKEQTVTGVVLQPEITDAQGDIISEDVIKNAAHDFLSKFNKKTELGYMHESFDKNFELYESWVSPIEFVLKNKIIKKGSWLITVKVNDADIWEMIEDGEITGFSIGGKATTVQEADNGGA